MTKNSSYFRIFLQDKGSGSISFVEKYFCIQMIQSRDPLYTISKWNNIHALFKTGFIATVKLAYLKVVELQITNKNFQIHTVKGKDINNVKNIYNYYHCY